MRQPDYLTCNNHSQVIVYVLDDLSDCIYKRGFGDGFHEGIVSLMNRQVNPIIISNCESLFYTGSSHGENIGMMRLYYELRGNMTVLHDVNTDTNSNSGWLRVQ